MNILRKLVGSVIHFHPFEWYTPNMVDDPLHTGAKQNTAVANFSRLCATDNSVIAKCEITSCCRTFPECKIGSDVGRIIRNMIKVAFFQKYPSAQIPGWVAGMKPHIGKMYCYKLSG